MDQERFDSLTRKLAEGHSRRSLLRGIGAGLLAGLGWGGVSATPKEGKGPKPGRCGMAGQPCKWNRQCCEMAGLVCYDGACSCLPGEQLINGACVPATDPCEGVTCEDNNSCTDSTCINGDCVHTPVAGRTCQREPNATGVCDATGACGPCTSDDECPDTWVCGGGYCSAPVCDCGELPTCVSSWTCEPPLNSCLPVIAVGANCQTVAGASGTCDSSGSCKANCTCDPDTACASYTCADDGSCLEHINTGAICQTLSGLDGLCTAYGTCTLSGTCLNGNALGPSPCPTGCTAGSTCEGCCSGVCVNYLGTAICLPAD